MFYSDHLRRFDIVGNAEGHQKPEESASILYIGYSFDQPDIPQTKIRELCRPFGEIKALGHVSQAKDNAYKKYFLVQFAKFEEAERAYKMILESKQKDFGFRVDISLVLDPEKFFRQSNPNHGLGFSSNASKELDNPYDIQ